MPKNKSDLNGIVSTAIIKKKAAGKLNKSDAFFHRVAMEVDGEIEKKDLEALEKLGPALAERQIISIIDAQHRQRALLGFQHLIQLYPNHPQRLMWEGLVRMLDKN
jgi:hypothetical protein